MRWALLAAAILAEVTGTLSLRMASAPRRASVTGPASASPARPGRRPWVALTVLLYAASFVLLAAALRAGLTIGVAYGIWTAVGVVLTAVASRVLFGEPLTRMMAAGIALVAAGVWLVESGAHSG